MGDLLSSVYPWVKAFHIISVISWMAGLLYLPRLFVYHSEQIASGVTDTSVFMTMEQKLYHFIMNRAFVATWLFGLLLIGTPGVVDFSSFWFWIKIAAVIGMSVYHVWLGKRQDDFERGENKISSKTYRLLNEVPAVLMVIIVIMVVVKPF